MIARSDIQAFVDQVVRQFRPLKVILFGSYAYGNPTPDSDVDLMLIMPHRGSSVQTATRIRLACPRNFPPTSSSAPPPKSANASASATSSFKKSPPKESSCMKAARRQ